MGVHRVSHQAWENQMLLGEVIDWQLHADHDSSPLSSKGHTLGENINNEDSDISPPQTMANFYTSACWWVEMQWQRVRSQKLQSLILILVLTVRPSPGQVTAQRLRFPSTYGENGTGSPFGSFYELTVPRILGNSIPYQRLINGLHRSHDTIPLKKPNITVSPSP